ncbi:hypothetical protein TIFTF001_026859 [Ficus carica]|uniref:UDP-glycosyltransferase n=1 Tax=Ficus carica TaxID=3494 RepID=A0AA88IZA0_FICCA|nr:hypothetical protein TIFTF001_026859 [Ficus carica]
MVGTQHQRVSVYEGVPMICWPRIGDQRVNARIVGHVWKVGIEMEENLERWKVESAIRRLMESEKGGEIRKRAVELKEKVTVSLRQGGERSVEVLEVVGRILGDYLLSDKMDAPSQKSFC